MPIELTDEDMGINTAPIALSDEDMGVVPFARSSAAPAPIALSDADMGMPPEPDPLHKLPVVGPLIDFFSGDWIRSVPAKAGVSTPAHRAIMLSDAAREQGSPIAAMLPGSQEQYLGEIPGSMVQFGANVAAGFAGFAGAKPGWEITKYTALAREWAGPLGNLALHVKHGNWTEVAKMAAMEHPLVPWWLKVYMLRNDVYGEDAIRAKYNQFDAEKGYSAEAALNKALVDGNLSLASHALGTARRGKEALPVLAWGLNPAVFQALMAEPGERTDAFLDGLYNYPIESTVGMFLGLKAIGKAPVRAKKVQAKLNGKPLVVEGQPVYYRETPIGGTARDLKVNAIGAMLFDRTPDFLRSPIWGVDSPAQRLHVRAQEIAIDSPSDSLRRMRTAEVAREGAGGYEQLYHDIKDAAAAAGETLTDTEANVLMIQVLDGSMQMVKDADGTPKLSRGKDAPFVPREAKSAIPTEEAAVARDTFGKALVELGLDPEDASHVLAAFDKTAIHAMQETLPEFAAEAVRLGGRGDVLVVDELAARRRKKQVEVRSTEELIKEMDELLGDSDKLLGGAWSRLLDTKKSLSRAIESTERYDNIRKLSEAEYGVADMELADAHRSWKKQVSKLEGEVSATNTALDDALAGLSQENLATVRAAVARRAELAAAIAESRKTTETQTSVQLANVGYAEAVRLGRRGDVLGPEVPSVHSLLSRANEALREGERLVDSADMIEDSAVQKSTFERGMAMADEADALRAQAVEQSRKAPELIARRKALMDAAAERESQFRKAHGRSIEQASQIDVVTRDVRDLGVADVQAKNNIAGARRRLREMADDIDELREQQKESPTIERQAEIKRQRQELKDSKAFFGRQVAELKADMAAAKAERAIAAAELKKMEQAKKASVKASEIMERGRAELARVNEKIAEKADALAQASAGEQVRLANVGYAEAHAARAAAGRKGKVGKELREGEHPAEAKRAHEFSMRRGRQEAVPEPLVKKPEDMYRLMLEGLKGNSRTAMLYGYRKLARKMRNDVRWHAWMDRADTPEVKGYAFLPHSPESPLAKRLFDAMDEVATAAGDFKLPITRQGQLLNTTAAKLFLKNANHLKKTKGGDAKLIAAIMAGPEVRFVSDDRAPVFSKWVASQMGDPDSVLYQHRELVRHQQRELIDVHGMDPLTVVSHWDAYLSRAWQDAAEMSVKLKQDLDLDLFGGPMKGTGPRHRRQLSEAKSAERLIDIIAKDPTSINAAEIAQFSVNNTQTLIENVRFFKSMKGYLQENNLLPGEYRRGFAKVMGSKDVKPGGIGDPYNFMFGALANEWVPESIARQMRGLRDMYRRAPALLTTWKMVKTIYRALGYQVRNEIGDWGNIIAASGYMPMSSQGRRARHNADLQMRQGDAGKTHARAAQMEAYGVAEQMMFDDVSGSELAVHGSKMAELAMKEFDATPETMQANMVTVANLLRTGDFPAAATASARKVRAGWDKAVANATRHFLEGKEAMREAHAIHVEKEGVGYGAKLAMTSEGLRELNRYIGSTGLARWTTRMEYRRRLIAFNLAIDEMKMTPPEAAQWVKNTLHDYGDKPGLLNRAQTNPVAAMFLPPFLTYGYKQAFHQLRVTMNNPQLFFLASMVRAMNAHDFSDFDPAPIGSPMHPEKVSERDSAFASMWQLSHLSSFGASRKYLGSGKAISEALQDLGFGDKMVRAFAGWDSRGVQHPLTITLPLRDISNLNTLINDLQPGEDTTRFLSRISPAIDFSLTVLSPDVFSPSQNRGANPTNRTLSEYSKRSLSYMADVFTPVPGWYNDISRIYQAASSAATGNIATRTTKNLPIYPLEAVTRVAAPGISISAIDQLNTQVRIQQKFKYKMADRQMKTSQYLNTLNPDADPDDRRDADLSTAWLTFYKHQVNLEMAYALHPESVGNFKKRMRDLQKQYQKHKQSILAKKPVSVQSLGTPEVNAIGGALMEAMEETWTSAP